MSDDEDVKAKYGFKVGDIVQTLVSTTDEHGAVIPAGEKLRLVCFAPKVSIFKPRENEVRYVDMKAYFFNAVRESQMQDYGKRIRGNFVTIKKLPPARFIVSGSRVLDQSRSRNMICQCDTLSGVTRQNLAALRIAKLLNEHGLEEN